MAMWWDIVRMKGQLWVLCWVSDSSSFTGWDEGSSRCLQADLGSHSHILACTHTHTQTHTHIFPIPRPSAMTYDSISTLWWETTSLLPVYHLAMFCLSESAQQCRWSKEHRNTGLLKLPPGQLPAETFSWFTAVLSFSGWVKHSQGHITLIWYSSTNSAILTLPYGFRISTDNTNESERMKKNKADPTAFYRLWVVAHH